MFPETYTLDTKILWWVLIVVVWPGSLATLWSGFTDLSLGESYLWAASGSVPAGIISTVIRSNVTAKKS
jgi:hypothetical protein